MCNTLFELEFKKDRKRGVLNPDWENVSFETKSTFKTLILK